ATLAIQQGRYISLDAEETLAGLMVNGRPDADLFHESIGGVVKRARSAGRGGQGTVAAFGEMVALLWAEGNVEAALRLEQLWNELARTENFHLRCAYPMGLFPNEEDSSLMERICAEHSHVVPAEAYSSLASDDDRLRRVAFLEQKAQSLSREVAARKKAQHELQLRETQLSEFLENAVVGLHWVAGDGTILWANKAEMDLLGYEREEYIGHHIAEFPVDAPVIEDMLRRLSCNQELQGYEARLRCKDGSIRHVRVYSNALIEDGKFIHTRCFTVNINEQKQAEMARLRLAAIVESSDDAIVSKDLNGIVTSWNRAAERMFGFKAEEIVGRPITLIIPPELQDDEPLILAKIRSGEKIEHFETVRITKNGERVNVSLTISPVKDDHGKVIGAAKIARNITERKKTERALILTEKLASVGRLAASVAHEINNPLEAVTNLIYLAKRDAFDGTKVAERLDAASQELDRVAHITRQTLGFYRDNSAPGKLDLRRVVDELVSLYGRRLQTRAIRVVKEYGESGEITGLEGEIRQVLSNLIANSIDAMPAGGTLTLRVAASQEWSKSSLPGVRITVADTGTGISREQRNHLFEPFYTTKKDVGTGLGLWITHGIVKKHGGMISVRSRVGLGRSGTVFSLFLPRGNPLKIARTGSLREESTAAARSEAGLSPEVFGA
ncbi:MAG TPA: PAS domain S-box protein, partial [Candidatus Angelobacter sp.]|nr:PAS domain S-box protein [Candidatus Angelobacter sp.]